MSYFNSVYAGKTVLITGHTGFKGSWLSLWLSKLGAKVYGLALDPYSDLSNYNASKLSECLNEDLRVDVTDSEAVCEIIERIKPDFVFHLAAQALVKLSYAEPVPTMLTNAIGSANVLEALRRSNANATVMMITSDKCYDNVEWVWGYRETDRLGGKDPYSASKAMAELAIRSFVDSFFRGRDCNTRVGIARAGNVIGGGDWALDRIVPDCMNAWSKGKIVAIRSPEATRPWQHVLEPLSGYLHQAARLHEADELHGEAYNFGPPAGQDYTVRQLIDQMGKYWEKIRWEDVSESGKHQPEAGLLRLNCDKAQNDLRWEPTMNFSETVEMTVDWYRTFYQNSGQNMRAKSDSQIEHYMQIADTRGRIWLGQ
ncbi:MAG: CDP-glucose 4,6-dehydratase [Paracoccaceae bacterium]|nr:CDP-glucose 4,6-dehydratase [Paracoccaceae bacterium]MDG2258385.1 CDP-glucose 4,6-dehydratase [Paracoccaceae bacterium]